MKKATIRDLRNRGGRVLDRVSRGETLTITRDRHAFAELRPLPVRPLSAEQLLARWRRLPRVDAVRLRRDVDSVINPAL